MYAAVSDVVHQRVDLGSIDEMVRIEFDNFFQGFKAAIVHIWAGKLDVAHGSGFVSTFIHGVAGNDVAIVGIGENRIFAVVVKFVGGKERVAETAVAVETIGTFFGGKKHKSAQFFRGELYFAVHVFIKSRIG